MKNIYLIGFMASGKTTVGQILAEKLNKEFVEMDHVVIARSGIPVKEIFKKLGEIEFRRLEKELLQEISKRTDIILSCGGGLACDNENRELLKATGNVVYLSASNTILHERIRQIKVRALQPVDNQEKALDKLMDLRKPFYEQAHLTVVTDALTPDAVADAIIKAFPAT